MEQPISEPKELVEHDSSIEKPAEPREEEDINLDGVEVINPEHGPNLSDERPSMP